MRFLLLDKIKEVKLGESLTAVKNLTLSEEYLADHFPGFPVMPGVLMLEAMTEAAAWLIRLTDNYADSIISLKEARNVKYNHFVQPGETLEIRVQMVSRGNGETKFKAEGWLGETQALSARLVLSHHSIGRDYPSMACKDAEVIEDMKKIYALIGPND
ncbi:MAG: 3-hydroxyacyl-ACP dehydratase FabZ family protein [Thermoguttaceae bacterium]|nr:3-hydroxyacyl-ACP dehydratase FabZ family protein [Thermoguttaceae bacterium]